MLAPIRTTPAVGKPKMKERDGLPAALSRPCPSTLTDD